MKPPPPIRIIRSSSSSSSSSSKGKEKIISPPTRPNSKYVEIKGFPEYQSVIASESISEMDVLIKLRAPAMKNDDPLERAPVDLVMVLDTGYIMTGLRLDHVKDVVNYVIDDALGPRDRLCVVSSRMDESFESVPFFIMTDSEGHEEAKHVVSSLVARGVSGVIFGLSMAADILERNKRPQAVPGIIFLCGGKDEYFKDGKIDEILHDLCHPSIVPKRGATADAITYPVHAIGIGLDHDPLVLYAISEASQGTYSFVESSEILQEAVALSLGCLTTVVAFSCEINIQAMPRVRLKSISSGRYNINEPISELQGTINIGDLCADELKEFLVTISVPKHEAYPEAMEQRTLLIDIVCTYRDFRTNALIDLGGQVALPRPQLPSLVRHALLSIDVSRQKARLHMAETIARAQELAENEDLANPWELITHSQSIILSMSPVARTGDRLFRWMFDELSETRNRMGNMQTYRRVGRPYALSNMSSHSVQKPTTRGYRVPGAEITSNALDHYVTSYVADKVQHARLLRQLPSVVNRKK